MLSLKLIILMVTLMNIQTLATFAVCTDDDNCSTIAYGNVSTSDFEPETIDISLALGQNEFKKGLRDKSRNKLRQQQVLDFHELLEKSRKVGALYSALTLVDDFDVLEDQFFRLKKEIPFLAFYQSLLIRISEYAKSPKHNENSEQYKKLYSFLYTAILSKIYVLKEKSEPNLIVDMGLYLDIVSKEFKDLKESKNEFNKVKNINEHNAEYKTRFENKIKEANEFIRTELTPEIESVNQLLDQQIDMLVQETKDKIGVAEEEREEAVERKNKLAKTVVLRAVFSVVKVCSQMFSFLGPVGAGVGAVVGGASSIAESFVLDNEAGEKQLTTLPMGVKNDLGLITVQMKMTKDKKIADFNRKLDLISEEMNTLGKDLVGPMDDISDIRKKLDELKKEPNSNPMDNDVIDHLEKQLKTSLENKETEIKAKVKGKDNKFVKTMRTMDRVNRIADFTATSVDVYNKFKSDKEKLDAASAAVEQANANLKQLEKYEDDIYNSIYPMVKSMGEGLEKAADQLKGKSPVALEVNKWKVQGALRDVKLTLRKFTKDFQIEEHLVRSIEKLEEVMTTLINVYDRIENYEEQKHLADYLNDINSASARDIVMSDDRLNLAVQHLEITINSNVVINDYDVAVSALKQWLFPFAHLYLQDLMLPDHLLASDRNSLQKVISNAERQITEVQKKMQLYQTAVVQGDANMFNGEFSSNYTSAKPFFTWSNADYQEEIWRFLGGKEISLRADVESSERDKDAIKFNFLKLYLKVDNISAQNDLDFALKGFALNATHTGNSYYRFNDKIFVFNCESQSIFYSFELNEKKEPVQQNTVYHKIKAGDLMLSPYTMWNLKLHKSSDKASFDQLFKFKDHVSLELSGYGSYVKKKYYK